MEAESTTVEEMNKDSVHSRNNGLTSQKNLCKDKDNELRKRPLKSKDDVKITDTDANREDGEKDRYNQDTDADRNEGDDNNRYNRGFSKAWRGFKELAKGIAEVFVDTSLLIRVKLWTILKTIMYIVITLHLFRLIYVVNQTQDEVQNVEDNLKETQSKHNKIIQEQRLEINELHDKNYELGEQLNILEEGQKALVGDNGEIAQINKQIVNIKNDYEMYMVMSQEQMLKLQNEMQEKIDEIGRAQREMQSQVGEIHDVQQGVQGDVELIRDVQHEMQGEIGGIRNIVGAVRNGINNVRTDQAHIKETLEVIEEDIQKRNCGLLGRFYGRC